MGIVLKYEQRLMCYQGEEGENPWCITFTVDETGRLLCVDWCGDEPEGKTDTFSRKLVEFESKHLDSSWQEAEWDLEDLIEQEGWD